MSLNEELLASLKDFILEQNSRQTDKLISHVDSRISELEKVIKVQSEKNEQLEREVQNLKARNHILEKQIHKNNIIVFNLGYKEGDLINFAINKLNSSLSLPISLVEQDVSNIYTVGSSENKPIIIHFVRYITKLNILKNCKNLKGSNIRISEILSVEKRNENKILYRYLKEAREKNLKAHIYSNKLFIEGKPYTVNELEKNNSEFYINEEETLQQNIINSKKTEPETQSNNEEEGEEENRSKKRKTSTRRLKQTSK